MGVRGRLILVTTLVLGLTVLAALALSVRLEDWEERRAEAERAEQRSIAFAAAILDELHAPTLGEGTQQVRRFVSTLERESTAFGIRSIYVLDRDGDDVAHPTSPTLDAFLQGVLANKEGGADPPPPAWPRRIATPIFVDGRRYVVVSVLDDQPLNMRLVERTRRLAGTNLVLSLMGLLILLTVLSREVLRPLAQLAEMAEKFGRGALQQTGGLDADAARELQQLATALRAAAARTGAQKEELEEEVARRTAELAGANAELSLVNARLQQLALTDPLTGLFNRRALDQALEHEVTRQKRGRRPFSLMMIDVDHFKSFNDTHGHAAGDVVLKGIARAIQTTLRASDIVARVGGEEFVVLLIDTELPHASTAADKVRLSVSSQVFEGGATQPQGKVTVSVGVASWPRHGDTAETVLAAADKALYAAKGAGRDRVHSAIDEAPTSEPQQPV
jgi:diguanylate cyclase (GGDEF)-like protein